MYFSYYFQEIFFGYYIDDPTDTLVKLSGDPATFSNFYDPTTALASSWKCVSLYVGVYYQERCDNANYALCSNVSNIGKLMEHTKIFVKYSLTA